MNWQLTMIKEEKYKLEALKELGKAIGQDWTNDIVTPEE